MQIRGRFGLPFLVVFTLVGLLFTPSASAVITYQGGPGEPYDPKHNTTAPKGTFANSGWDFVGEWRTELGVFSGTAIAPHYFVTAKHVGGKVGEIFRLNGKKYVTEASIPHPGPSNDLILWRVKQKFSSFAPLYSLKDEHGKEMILFGRGTQRAEEVWARWPTAEGTNEFKGWKWGPRDGVLRWGLNRAVVQSFGGINQLVDHLSGSFSRDWATNAGPNLAHLSEGDSGGAAFIHDGQSWKLAGVVHGSTGIYRLSLESPGFSAAILAPRGLYPATGTSRFETNNNQDFYCTRISSHVNWIRQVTGLGK